MIAISLTDQSPSRSPSVPMTRSLFSVSLFALLCSCTLALEEIVVRIRPGSSPEQLARQHGMRLMKQLDRFPNTYVFTKIPKLSKRIGLLNGAKDEMTSEQSTLASDTRIEWAELQEPLERTKRGHLPFITRVFSTQHRSRPTAIKSSQLLQSHKSTFKDPFFRDFEWYLKVDADHSKDHSVDMKIDRAWDMGFTGKGIVVSIVDDGIEHNHTDLAPNYDARASYDANDNDDDPFPRYDASNSNAHGTKCAGEVAMVANNGVCGVGVAFNAKIGGIRCLDGSVTDQTEAIALTHAVDHIDIYSSSWGPKDDGKSVDGPKALASEALQLGVTVGRGGRGVIYIWASGNGGQNHDNCNCDGYVSSIYTLSIGAVTQHGEFPWYGERCASTLAVAFSSGSLSESKVFTTTLHGQCAFNHTGTSAAAPIAAGVIALLLESNPNLTWRDVKHLIVWTSSVNQLMGNRGWRKNAVGLLYNSRFGFGLIDASALILHGARWQSVGPLVTCNKTSELRLPYTYRQQDNLILLSTDGCRGSANEVNSLEYASVQMTIETVKRGRLEIFLTSPSGTVSMLLSKRKLDTHKKFTNWAFTSAHFWGEQPRGTWQLYIRDKSLYPGGPGGSITSINLILYGTKHIPEHLKKNRVYPYEVNVNNFIDNEKEWNEEDGFGN